MDGDKNSSAPVASLSFNRLIFSDGTTVEIAETDIVVFVGPNNAGKSVALRELEESLDRREKRKIVFNSVESVKLGDSNSVIKRIESSSKSSYPNGTLHYSGSGYNINASQVSHFWDNDLSGLRAYFCRRLKTETRILDSNPSPSFKGLTEPPVHPIQSLYSDDSIEKRISGYFRNAFGSDLIVFRGGGSEIPLLVGDLPDFDAGEDRVSASYLEKLFHRTVPLREQGDGMRSFASVVLQMLAVRTPTILLLDEPEAFLHPPQARLLGEFLAKERPVGSQLFVATHSSDVLVGLLRAAAGRLKIIRLQRNGNVNHAKELPREKTLAIANDPMSRFSSILSGIFYKRVIVCESDADCLFYQAILSLPLVHGDTEPDVLFLHASGKHRIANVAEALRSLNVMVDVIVDIDILNDQMVFSKILSSVGGKWEKIAAAWKAVRSAIESRKAWTDAPTIVKQIKEILSSVKSKSEFPKTERLKIESILKNSTAWAALKQAGDAAIPSGDPTEKMKEIREYCEKFGLWIVPVGELERFCKSIGNHGPKWVQQVIDERDIAADVELGQAREFVRKIWKRIDGF